MPSPPTMLGGYSDEMKHTFRRRRRGRSAAHNFSTPASNIASSRKSTNSLDDRNAGNSAVSRSKGMIGNLGPLLLLSTSAQLYSSSTHLDEMLSGETTNATAAQVFMPRSMAVGNCSPAGISSQASHTLKPRSTRADFSRTTQL